MFVPLPIVVALAVIALLLIVLRLRGPGERRDLVAPPPLLTLSPGLEDEVRTMVAGGRKIDAIKRVREATGADLAAAKALVERIGRA